MKTMQDINWDDQPLGKESDADIALALGVKPGLVAYHRRRLGIEAAFRRAPVGIAWDEQPLGKMADTDLARELGVTSQAVRIQRTKRGIPKFSKYAQTP